jgi:hypothetical protein
MAVVSDMFLRRQSDFLANVFGLIDDGYPTRCRRAMIHGHGLIIFGFVLKDEREAENSGEPRYTLPPGCLEPPRHCNISPALLCVTNYVASRLTDIKPLDAGSWDWDTETQPQPDCPEVPADCQGGDDSE